YYQTTIDLDPGHAAAHYSLAYVLRAQGKPEEALVYLRKASDLLPDDPSPLNGLAWELATCAEPKLRDPGQAIFLARKVVALSVKQGDDRDHPGRHGNYWNTLGVAHYRAGQLNEAVDALQKSLDLGTGGGDRYICLDWYFLAMANWKLDRKDEARKWYDRAVEWTAKKGPKDDTLRRYRAEAAALLGIEGKE
ncbi:MAG TPA: tetratricopeptide repeat protein, partial [Gemmataceae bacterium]|nr:tetratricopeptide repeat protein [Gemmataceae bacterium]